MTKKVLQGFALVVGIVIVLSGITLWTDRAQAPVVDTAAGTVSVAIDGLYTGQSVDIFAGETALQVLQNLDKQNPAMQLKTKEYSGLGTLVEGMGTLHNGDGGNYWQYKVNDTMPQVGADAYVLHSGDSLNWFFGASQE